jgi:dihydrofolate reductase
VRQVVAYELLSLDGVAESPDQFVTEFDDVMRENLGRVIATQDTVLLGRRTYDEWARFWPGSTIEPFASFINGVPKLVVTSTPLGEAWANAEVLDGDVTAGLSRLKQQSGGDIGVHGSVELARLLLERGLVDQLRLVIAPALQRHGRMLFEGGAARRLTLTRTVVSPAGYLLLDYHVDG